MFVPFDEYEKKIIRELLNRVNKARKEKGDGALTEPQLVRGLVRQSIHDIIGFSPGST